jgi:hypothetical protein
LVARQKPLKWQLRTHILGAIEWIPQDMVGQKFARLQK